MKLVAVAVVRSVKCANGSNWLDGEKKERKRSIEICPWICPRRQLKSCASRAHKCSLLRMLRLRGLNEVPDEFVESLCQVGPL